MEDNEIFCVPMICNSARDKLMAGRVWGMVLSSLVWLGLEYFPFQNLS